MSQESQKITVATNVAELGAVFGPPPVLSSESLNAYEEIWARLMECFAPSDFMEQLLIKDLAVCTWDIMRYTRHKTLAMERKSRQRLEFQAKRQKAAMQRRDEHASELAERAGKPVTQFERMFDLEDELCSTIADVDAILQRVPAELDHARALEEGIEYHERLDKLLNDAIRRRNDALDQLDRYRDGLGRRLREASDKIIDADFDEVALQPEQVAPPLAPSLEEKP